MDLMEQMCSWVLDKASSLLLSFLSVMFMACRAPPLWFSVVAGRVWGSAPCTGRCTGAALADGGYSHLL